MEEVLDKALLEKLKASLSKKRYQHSEGVCDTAVRLARKFGADEKKAAVAGILHDCAKGMKIPEQIEKCAEYGLPLDEITQQCAPVIHAPLGAEMAKREYGIRDEEILNAIRRHTVGGKGMTLLDKILYTADMIEPHREFDGVERLRAEAEQDLETAFFDCVRQSLIFNIQENKMIHPDTLICYNEWIGRENH